MSDSLLLEILKSLQAGPARIEHALRENTARLVELGGELRHQGVGRNLDQERMARLEPPMDTLRADLDRVNVRLGLTEG